MRRVILMDLDDTLLDFHRAEAVALTRLGGALSFPTDAETIALYSRLNEQFWKRYERGEITRQEVLIGRFRAFFTELGRADEDAARAKALYETYLSEGHYFIDGAEALLRTLAPRYDLYLASNGTEKVQRGRLQSAGIAPYFHASFLSERIGYAKPSPAYFDAIFAAIGEERRAGAVMVGDSLTSDIRGGAAAGLITVWFNPSGKPCDPAVTPDRTIAHLSDLPAIIDSLPPIARAD